MTSTSIPQPPRMRGLGSVFLLVALGLIVLLILRWTSSVAVVGGASSPPPIRPSSSAEDFAREARVRRALDRERWEQVLGEDDTAIARALRLQNQRCADFAGVRGDAEWLVAESKGSNIDHAVEQLSNTLRGIRAKGLPVKSVELRIYFKPEVWARLTNANPAVNNFGYRVINNAIVSVGENEQWVELMIDGIKVQGFLAP